MTAWHAPEHDPFLYEDAAQSWAEIMRGTGLMAPAEYRTHHRGLMLRATVHRLRSNAGDLADGITSRDLEPDLRHELLTELHKAQQTLARAEALLTREDQL